MKDKKVRNLPLTDKTRKVMPQWQIGEPATDEVRTQTK